LEGKCFPSHLLEEPLKGHRFMQEEMQEASAPPFPAPQNVQRPWLALTLLCVAQFMMLLDFSIVNVALPSLQRSLALSPQNLQWVASVYALFYGGFLLLGGRVADLFGRRRIFVSGLLLFTCASLLGGLATSGGVLIAARGAQGLGAALLSPAAFSLLTTTFAEGPARNRALGIWGTLAAVGVVTGVLLGGILTAELGWRWIFFLNVPIGFLAAIFAMLWLQESRSAAVKREIDWIGAVMVTSGLIALVYAVVGTNDVGVELRFLSVAVALLLLTAFVVFEARIRAPLVPLGLLQRRSLMVTNIIFFLQAMAAGATAFIMTLYLQEVLNYSALQTGLAFLPLGMAGVIGGPVAFQLVSRLSVKRTAVLGLFAELVALILLSRVSIQNNFLIDVLPGLGLFGLGIVLSLVALTIETAAGVNDADQGLVGGCSLPHNKWAQAWDWPSPQRLPQLAFWRLVASLSSNILWEAFN
jgi:EmrB/QacA subfamily drug resistance transporter